MTTTSDDMTAPSPDAERAPVDESPRLDSDSGHPQHRAALAIDCPACFRPAGQWCVMPEGCTWALCGARIPSPAHAQAHAAMLAELRAARERIAALEAERHALADELGVGHIAADLLAAARKLKALAVTSLARSPLLPGVPTLVESGVAGYEVNTWFGFITKSGTPPEIVGRLHTEILKVLGDAALKDKLAQQGFELAAPTPSAQFARIIADDLTKWVPIVRQSGAKAD